MPSYTYHCDNCGHEFDRQQSFSENPLKKCPNCSKLQLRKVYRPARVVFKGSGFYTTDNKSGLRGAASNSNGKSEEKKDKPKDKTTEAGKSGENGKEKSSTKAAKTETKKTGKSE